MREPDGTYPLLGELTGTLVLGVAEQLDHTLLVGGQSKRVKCVSHMLCPRSSKRALPDTILLVRKTGREGWVSEVRGGFVVDLPGNLLDDVPNESGALAQVALGARDTGLDDARGGLLYGWQQSYRRSASSTSIVHSLPRGRQRRDPPRGETGKHCRKLSFNVRGPC